MSFEMNKFNVVKKKRLEKSELNVECNISTEVEIDKILSVCHTAQVENVEVLNGMINYSANIDLCMLYCTVDGEIGTITSSCPFTSKFEDGSVMVGDKASIKLAILEHSIESVTGSNVKINVLVEQSGTLIGVREINNVTTGDPNVCVKEDEMMVNTLVGEATELFNVESDFAIKEPVKKILLSDSQVSIKNVESGVNFVSVSGEVVTRLLYLTEKDRFETSYVTENFKEEVELEGVTRDAVSEAFASIKKNSVKCEIDSDEKGVNVKLTIPVMLKAVSYQETSTVVVKDIYSTCNELEVSTESFEMSRQFQSDCFEAKIDGNLTLDENQPRVDKIMFVGGTNFAVTNSYLKNGEVFVEGITKTNVVYLNDETNNLHSVTIEVPFVVSDKANISCEEAEVDVSVSIYDVDVVVKKGREFYFDAKLKVCVEYDCKVIGAVISNINQASEYPEKDCAVELVFATQGQSAWDIAKLLKVKEETVLLQNPDLVFPLEQDSNVVIFYQKRS